MRYTAAAFVAAALAGVSSAWTQPTGPKPIGNPFKTPELASQVPKGTPYEVTWEPTIDKAGTVTILLLHGPSTNAVAQYAIAEKIPNSGSFMWTPSENIDPESTHYGLQLIVDATGQYQYTPQFGITGKKPSTSSTSSASGYPVSPVPSSYPEASSTASSRPAEPSKATSTPSGYSQAPDTSSGTAVPPAPSSSKTGPVYLTSTMQVTTCSYPTVGSSGTAPAASGSSYPIPPGNPGMPSAPYPTGPPAGTPPAGTAPGAGTATAPGASQSTIATGAAGKTVAASGIAIVAAFFALAL